MGDYVVIRADLIQTEREARRYYENRLAGFHTLSCHGRTATVYFAKAGNHVYTEEWTVEPQDKVIRRRIGPDAFDERVFCLDRARLMDSVLPAIRYFTFSIPGEGRDRARNRLLHGPRLKDGRYLCVVLGPGPDGSWLCKTAYPITAGKWAVLRRAKTVKFPP